MGGALIAQPFKNVQIDIFDVIKAIDQARG